MNGGRHPGHELGASLQALGVDVSCVVEQQRPRRLGGGAGPEEGADQRRRLLDRRADPAEEHVEHRRELGIVRVRARGERADERAAEPTERLDARPRRRHEDRRPRRDGAADLGQKTRPAVPRIGPHDVNEPGPREERARVEARDERGRHEPLQPRAYIALPRLPRIDPETDDPALSVARDALADRDERFEPLERGGDEHLPSPRRPRQSHRVHKRLSPRQLRAPTPLVRQRNELPPRDRARPDLLPGPRAPFDLRVHLARELDRLLDRLRVPRERERRRAPRGERRPERLGVLRERAGAIEVPRLGSPDLFAVHAAANDDVLAQARLAREPCQRSPTP